MWRRPLSALLLAAAVFACTGCGGDGGDRLPVFPVKGKVLVGGKPADGAFVVFRPKGVGPDRPRPNAYTAADGTFELSTYEASDGAPPGDYEVAIVWTPGVDPSGDSEAEAETPDRLKGRYADPKSSDLEARLVEGPNELPPFDLKGRTSRSRLR